MAVLSVFLGSLLLPGVVGASPATGLPPRGAQTHEPATPTASAEFRFVPLGAAPAQTAPARRMAGTSTLSGVATMGNATTPYMTVEWYAPVDGVWQHGSTTTDIQGAYTLGGVPAATGDGELWCYTTLTDGPNYALGRVRATWPEGGSTTFDFPADTFAETLERGGPWSDWTTSTTWLYGYDARSELMMSTEIKSPFGTAIGAAKALASGVYEKAAVYYWANEGQELDLRLRRMPDYGHIVAAQFATEKVGWMVANGVDTRDLTNVVLRTTDGGLQWTPYEAAVGTNLSDISFIDTLRGWAVGIRSELVGGSTWTDFGVIFATQDGGVTWSSQTSPVESALSDVDFVDATHGWAVGSAGTIINTGDGGETWVPQSSGVTDELRDVDFVDASHGWVVGVGGTVLVTSDGGATWTPQTLGTSLALNVVHFSDAQHGFVAGLNGIGFTTISGGQAWVPTSTGVYASATAVAFADESTGWVVGANRSISKTVNGGVTWSPQLIGATGPVTQSFSTVACADGAHVVAGGRYGVLTDTADGGALWSTTAFSANETDAQRLTATSRLGMSGSPGSTVKLSFEQYPAGQVSLLSGDPEFPESASDSALGTYTSRGGTKETKNVILPKTAKPGYRYWFGAENRDGVLFLETPFQVSLLKASRTAIASGGSVKLTGVVPTKGHLGSIAGSTKRCRLFKSTRSATGGYRFVKYVRADGLGRLAATNVNPTRTTWYLVYYPKDGWYWADVTTPVKITVR